MLSDAVLMIRKIFDHICIYLVNSCNTFTLFDVTQTSSCTVCIEY